MPLVLPPYNVTVEVLDIQYAQGPKALACTSRIEFEDLETAADGYVEGLAGSVEVVGQHVNCAVRAGAVDVGACAEVGGGEGGEDQEKEMEEKMREHVC
jgi:hypothetical protein